MRISINQPTFLPWMGYFRMIEKSDVFVLLDDVQFSRSRSWQYRTKLPCGFLTLPVEKHAYRKLIKDVELKFAPTGHIELLEREYQPSMYLDWLKKIISLDIRNLARFNCELIQGTCEWLDLPAPEVLASQLSIPGENPTDRLVKICEYFGATTYLSPIGSKAYLDTEQFNQAGIEVEWNIVPGQEGINEYSCVDHILTKKETPKGLTSEASSGLSDKG